MTKEELTKQVCAAASDILGKPVDERRLDIGTKGLIAVLSDDTPFKTESHPDQPEREIDDDRAETENAGGEKVDGNATADNE